MKTKKSFWFEQTDVMTWLEHARKQGLTLSEWIRRQCNAFEAPDWDTTSRTVYPGRVSDRRMRPNRAPKNMSGNPNIPVAGRSIAEPAILKDEHMQKLNELVTKFAAEGKCPHSKRHGELCYKCDAKFGLPIINE